MAAAEGAMRTRLSGIAEEAVAAIVEHPFWAGLRSGTLPAGALVYFAEQDLRYLLPAYARALARTAALATDDGDAAVLVGAAAATFSSLPRVTSELVKLTAEVGDETVVQAPGRAPGMPGPGAHAYASFLLAAPTVSYLAGVGGLLPLTWLHQLVGGDLRARYDPGSRYAAWIGQYCPIPEHAVHIEPYLSLVDEAAARCSAAGRDELAQYFTLGVEHEWNLADSAWRQQEWPG